MSEAESAQDSAQDQEANTYGRNQGTQNPYGQCEDMIDIYRPEGLPSGY